MEISSQIFKAYDIRGVYPKEVNEEIAFKIGRAFYEFLKAERRKPLKIIVGRDNRVSSKALLRAVKNGIEIQGGNIIDIGLSTTPMFYFGVNFLEADGGIVITASHNPSQYNGFKLVRKKAIPISGETGIKEIRKLAIAGDFKKRKKGAERKKKILNEYIRYNLRFLDQSKISPLKIVVDTANAVSGILMPKISDKIKKLKIYHLFSKLDGNFPNHNPDPLIKENLKPLQKEVIRKKADFGIAFDGDGDRIFFVDEKGKIIAGDLITALIAKIILEDSPGEKILYDIRSSKIVGETIKNNKGKTAPSRIGHSFIKKSMRKQDIIFGGELSGHYYSKENNFCEAPFFVLFKIIEEVSKEKKPLSKIILPFRKYINSGEINFKIEDKIEAMRKVEKYFKSKKCKISHLDGTKIDFKKFWFLLRPSNTESLLRLIVEADNKEILRKKISQIKKIISSA